MISCRKHVISLNRPLENPQMVLHCLHTGLEDQRVSGRPCTCPTSPSSSVSSSHPEEPQDSSQLLAPAFVFPLATDTIPTFLRPANCRHLLSSVSPNFKASQASLLWGPGAPSVGFLHPHSFPGCVAFICFALVVLLAVNSRGQKPGIPQHSVSPDIGSDPQGRRNGAGGPDAPETCPFASNQMSEVIREE